MAKIDSHQCMTEKAFEELDILLQSPEETNVQINEAK